jgi:CRISPR/Cas system CSM-associated protein Csm3 (group 7 of RAMP superfamily)
MMTIPLSVRFHEPFLVRSGQAEGGKDAVARPDAVLPSSSLKGAMRAACEHVLQVDPAVVTAIFGRPGATGGILGQGAWAWSHAGPEAAFRKGVRARNRIDGAAGVVRPEALTYTQEWWQADEAKATFEVEQITALTAPELDRQLVVLHVAAYAVTALGSWRNRGMGTVTVRPLEPLERLDQRWAQVDS